MQSLRRGAPGRGEGIPAWRGHAMQCQPTVDRIEQDTPHVLFVMSHASCVQRPATNVACSNTQRTLLARAWARPICFRFSAVSTRHSYTQGRSEPVLARHCHCIVAPCLGYNAVSESTSTVLISLNGFRVRSHTHVLLSVSCGLSQQVAGSLLLGVDTDCPNPVKLRRLLGVDTEVVNKAAGLSMARCRHRLS